MWIYLNVDIKAYIALDGKFAKIGIYQWEHGL